LAEDKAKDILDKLQLRGVVGERMKSSVGRRAWERPRVAISSRLYKQYRVPDPWDPSAKRDSTPIGLGPVSLRLGQKRRQPAPHLKPKEPKKPQQKVRDPFAGLPNVPKAKPRAPAPKPEPPKPAVQAKSDELSEKEIRAAEVAARMRAAEAARGGAWRRASAAQGAPSRGVAPALPVRPDVDEVVRSRPEAEEATVAPSSRASASTGRGRGSSGRFRMSASPVTNAPVVRRRVEPQSEEVKAIPEEDLTPPPRRPMPAGGSATMDDFFSAAAQMGRLAMPSREEVKPKDAPEKPDGGEE